MLNQVGHVRDNCFVTPIRSMMGMGYNGRRSDTIQSVFCSFKKSSKRVSNAQLRQKSCTRLEQLGTETKDTAMRGSSQLPNGPMHIHM